MNFAEWGDSLILVQYLEESDYLKEVPLVKNGKTTSRILTNRTVNSDQKPILESCETFRKRAFITNKKKILSECIVHEIASVFVDQNHRRQGYGTRLMHELAEAIFK